MSWRYHTVAGRHRPCKRRGFTLLEIIITVVILGILAVVVNRFVVSTMRALAVSEEISEERKLLEGVANMVQAQLSELPPTGAKRLVGVPHKFGTYSSDAMEWTARPGLGVLTGAADGDYRVSLELKPSDKSPSVLELGLRRGRVNGAEYEESWLPLLSPVTALEIRYYHPQLAAKVDRWNDPNTLPSLVFFSIQRNPDEPPYEAVLTVPAAKLRQ